MKKLLLSLIALLLLGGLQAQPLQTYCAAPPGKPDWLIRYQQNPDAYPRSFETLYVPMTVHLVGTDQGMGYYSENLLYRSFCELNKDFEAANIQFYLAGGINYVNDSDLYTHESSFQALQIMQIHNVPNTINCYVVDNAAGACGYAWLGSDNGIVLLNNCIGAGDHTWAHEAGHFLSLPHTFSGWEGIDDTDFTQPAPAAINDYPVERMDGSNCEFAGDGFCDTPPDYLSFRWSCTASNAISSQVQLDPDSIAFQSDGSLFMSYSGDICMSRFSEGQIAAMRANLFDRSYLIDEDYAYGPIPDGDYVLSSPVDDAFQPNYNNITLEWEAVPNAEYYVVQINPFPIFTDAFFEYVATANSITVSDLLPNRTYYWRIRPYNSYNLCTSYSGHEKFSTGELVAVKELPGLDGLSVFPNPKMGNDESLYIRFTSDRAFNASLTLYDLTGKAFRSFPAEVNTGYNDIRLPLTGTPAGMFLLGLKSSQGEVFEKVVIGN